VIQACCEPPQGDHLQFNQSTSLSSLPYGQYVLFAYIVGWENCLTSSYVDRYLLKNLVSQLNLHCGEAPEHISLEDDGFDQHSFKLPDFKPTDLKATLSSLTALWTSQMYLSQSSQYCSFLTES